MKIAQIAPLYESVPPSGYGGTERVVSWLCESLTDLGHDVTLFASGGSRSKAKVITFRDQPLRTDPAICCDPADHIMMLNTVRKMADDFDVIHFHTDLFQMPFFEDYAHKTVTTLHGRLDLKSLPEFYDQFNTFPLVSISEHQRRAAPMANYIGTVYHGLPLDTYKPNLNNDQEYVAFLGRFSPEKGAEKAIAIAGEVGWPIKLAAKICRQSPANEVYYNTLIEPQLGKPGIEYIGEIGDKKKNEFLGNAKAVLFPINWPEPFGLVMIEALACGTPVIAFDCGSVPEILEDGVTGFIVKTQEAAVEALKRIDTLDRRVIRDRFEKRFSSKVMALSYCNLYETLMQRDDEAAAASIVSWQHLAQTTGIKGV